MKNITMTSYSKLITNYKTRCKPYLLCTKRANIALKYRYTLEEDKTVRMHKK